MTTWCVKLFFNLKIHTMEKQKDFLGGKIE